MPPTPSPRSTVSVLQILQGAPPAHGANLRPGLVAQPDARSVSFAPDARGSRWVAESDDEGYHTAEEVHGYPCSCWAARRSSCAAFISAAPVWPACGLQLSRHGGSIRCGVMKAWSRKQRPPEGVPTPASPFRALCRQQSHRRRRTSPSARWRGSEHSAAVACPPEAPAPRARAASKRVRA